MGWGNPKPPAPTVTSSNPASCSAPLNFPSIQLQPGPPEMLPSRPLLELSRAIAPAASSNVQCATSPVGRVLGATVATPSGAGVQPPEAAASRGTAMIA